MKSKTMKKLLAGFLAVCLVAPAISYLGTVVETKAADTTVVSEVGDTDGDGKIDAKELVRVKKSALPPNQAAAITINKMGSNTGKMSFITKEAYVAGSTVTFDILIPENLSSSWWGIGYATSVEAADLYTHSSAAMNLSVTLGEWSHCSFTLPKGEGSYYLYLLAAVGEWPKSAANAANTVFLIDNFKITTSDATVEDNFNNGFEEGLFNVNPNGEEAVSLRTLPGQDELKDQCDLNNDGACENADADLMRKYLVDKIYSFYRPDTSSVSNDTSTYKVTDELDREMTDTVATKSGKAVGIRYFLHLGTEESNALYSVSNILTNDPSAYASSDAWEAAGGGAVGTKHWWGSPLFGYYTSLDKWVVERDVQMLTDAGIDFLAIDTEDGIYESQLTLLLEVLDKYYDQGYNVPKVTFTSDVSSSVASLKNTYSHLWYTTDTIAGISNMQTVRAARSLGSSMSASAFYEDTINHQRDFNGKKHINDTDSELQGYNFKWEFENAVDSGASTILVESWNEWLSERKSATNDSQPIVLEENADMANSSDFQPMEEGYGDSYYMQLIDCIKAFKGNTISNNKLNTAVGTESVTIDINGDFKQWNKVSTHYLDYTDEIGNRDAEAYEQTEIIKNNVVAFEACISDSSTYITKKAYAGGSTVSFRAYIPTGLAATSSGGSPWWVVCATTSSSSTDIYSNWVQNWNVSSNSSELGQWVEKTINLPNDGKNYYIYFAGEAGQWKDSAGNNIQILIDDFKVTSSGTTETDSFDNGLTGGLFNASGSAFTLSSTSMVKKNQALAIDVFNLSDGKPMNVMTKDAYPGGSTVSFEAYVPEGITSSQGWWGAVATTDPSSVDIYSCAGNNSLFAEAKVGKWAKYTIELPKDGQNYYIGIGGATGSGSDWYKDGGKALLIENFTVTSSDGEVLDVEDFNAGLSGIFNIQTAGLDGSTCVSAVAMQTKYTDDSGRNDISRMKMTTDGSYLYALVETVDAIQGWGEANCMSLFISSGNVGGCWNQYEYVVNRDSSKATSNGLVIEKYVSGAWKNVGTATYRIEGNLMHLAIPLSALDSSDAFELEFKWADNYSEDDIYSLYKSGDMAPYGRVNYVYSAIGRNVAITVDKMGSNDGRMSFITKNAYPAGSTVTFDILVPEKNDSSAWWGIGFAASPSEAGLYKWNTEGTHCGQTMSSTIGDWDTVTVDIPSGYGDQYIYLVASVGQWSDTVFQLDNFEITNGGNVIARESFNSGYGIFNADENAVALQSESSSDSNQSAEIHMYKTYENGTAFMTNVAYPGGSTITFKAYAPSTIGWWGVGYSYSTTGDVYGIAGINDKMGIPLTGETVKNAWKEYTVTLPEGGPYYVYIGGEIDANKWDGPIYIDDFKVLNSQRELIAKDNFSQGLADGLFKVTEDTAVVKLGLPTETEAMAGNYAASFVTNASETALAITSEAYPAGSTVTFDAYVPNDATWWGLVARESDATDYDNINIYHAWNNNAYYKGEWSTYTATLPESGGPYYFYFATECTQWSSNLLIDNVVVRSASGTILTKEDFNIASFDASIFTVLNSSAISLVEEEEDIVDVHFTAYDAPTINGQVSGDATATIDAAYKALADAGFTKALALREGYTTVAQAQSETGSTAFADYVKWRTEKYDSAATVALDIAAKHGLSYYTKDWSFYNLGKTSTDESVIDSTKISAESDFQTVINTVLDNSTFLNHSAYAGHYASDEPADSTTDFNALKYQAKYYNQIMQKKGLEGEMYVNLNPAYGPQDDRTWWDKLVGNEADKYNTDYVNSYVQKYLNVATASDSKINYISWDYYPFMLDSDDDKQLREENYLYNFNVMAKAAKNNNLGLRYTLQSTGEQNYGLRDITSAADFRFQIYTGMAFGVNDFTYYKYGGTNGEGIFDYMTGETNQTVYGYAKEVNNEVHAIEDFFADYKWDSIMAKQGTNTTTMSDRMIGGVQLSNSDSISHGKISSVTATQDTLCGIFNAVDTAATSRPYGYMFVNIADPVNNASDTVTINFADSVKGVCVCINGKQTLVKVSGSYTFTLEAGAGAFIVPIQ